MEEYLTREVLKDKWMISILESVRDLSLPDCWVGAGFVRNKAWDLLHNYHQRTPLSDIDVVFFDQKNLTREYEDSLELRLKRDHPNIKWEVVNQAKTHLWHNHPPYKSTIEAISKWIETATCIGIRLTKEGEIRIAAPYGLDDLEKLILRPIPGLKNLSAFEDRIERKEWLKNWPKLTIMTQ